MKALTICQPYAELIARGEKVVENRTWMTPYRGPLAIHAGKSRDWLDDDERNDPRLGATLAFGAVIAVATLVDCVRYSALPLDLREHEHSSGPWCWVLRDVIRLPAPITVRGAQGLWQLDAAVANHIALKASQATRSAVR